MEKIAKLEDIAKALNISIGTVDRALNNRPGVSPITKARVQQMAKALSYRPNLAARMLSSRKRLRISVNLPAQTASFWDTVRDGIRSEAGKFLNTTGVGVEFHTFSRYGHGEEEAFEEALASQVDGIIASTARPQQLRPLIRKAARAHVPVLAVVSDAPGTERLAAVGIDSLASGALAGELLSRFVQGTGKLAMITGDLAVNEHEEKFRSFHEAVQLQFPGITVLDPLENHEDANEAREQCRLLLENTKDLRGIYISTSNSIPVLEALKRTALLGKVAVIATDLFPELAPYIESGGVLATLYQRPFRQGQLAFRLLHNFLAEDVCPSPQLRLAPLLVMKSNLRFFPSRALSSEEFDETEVAAQFAH
jgi:LacI family transcriptional regulator